VCNATLVAPPTEGKRQLLVIGDSISFGWVNELNLSFTEWQIVHAGTHPPVPSWGGIDNNGNTNWISHCLAGWLTYSPKRWEVIVINAGLHDLAVDNQHVNLDSYTMLLQGIMEELLVHTSARIIWLTSTPAPTDPPTPLFPVRIQSAVEAYNAAAAATVAVHTERISTCDLFGAVCAACANNTAPAYAAAGVGSVVGTATAAASTSALSTPACIYSTCPLQVPGGIHFEAAGWSLLGRTVKGCITKLYAPGR
jgi:hypothetical protein